MGPYTYLKACNRSCSFLFDIFTTFGPSLILQSDNDKEFVSSIIIELVNLWPTIQIINGRPRHPASQDLRLCCSISSCITSKPNAHTSYRIFLC